MATVRIATIFATRWPSTGLSMRSGDVDVGEQPRETAAALRQFLNRDGARPEIEFIADRLAGDEVSFPGPGGDVEVRTADLVVCLPATSAVVVALVVVVAFEPWVNADDAAQPLVALMGQCFTGAVRIRQRDFVDHLEQLTDGRVGYPFDGELLVERYQLLFLPATPLNVAASEPVVRRLMFGGGGFQAPAFNQVWQPEDLNDHAGVSGDVGTRMSILCGHDRLVEDALLASAVYAVGRNRQLSHVRHETLNGITSFLRQSSDLELLADNLANLQFELARGVQPPQPRVVGFHHAIEDALDLPAQGSALSGMLNDIGTSLSQELTSIDIRERRRAESEKNWNVVSAIVLSPLSAAGFIVTFLGINASQVNNGSMWSNRYAPLYFIATVMALAPAALIVLPHLRDRADAAYPVRRRSRRPAVDTLIISFGALIGGLAILRTFLAPSLVVANAVAEAAGLVLLLLGCISVMWRQQRRRPERRFEHIRMRR
jgi:hypothetical protein